MATLQLEHVGKTFPGNVRAVDDLTLTAADGELTVLVGPSGCGKTTTLRMIAGLESVSRGTIRLDGRELNGVSPRERNVAMVMQHHALYPHLSVFGNMAFGLRMRGVGRGEIDRRVREAARSLVIDDLLDRRPSELSGGQRQRAALGRAIVRDPAVFLFDEPLSNLDPGLRARLRGEIRRLHARLGATMVYVTHDQIEAMTLGRRIAVMGEGRLHQVADPATLYDRPADRFVAEMIGSPAMNLLEGRIGRRQGRLIFDGGGFLLPVPDAMVGQLDQYVDHPVTLGVRPEHVGTEHMGTEHVDIETIHAVLIGAETVRESEGARSPPGPALMAEVDAVERLGPESYATVTAAGHTLVARVSPAANLRTGVHVPLAFAADDLHFFAAKTGERIG